MTEVRNLWVLAGAAAVAALAYLLTPILTPFVLAAVIAYVGNPLVGVLVRWRLPRTLAVVVVFLGFFLVAVPLGVLLASQLQKQAVLLVRNVPHYLDWIQSVLLPWLQAVAGPDVILFDIAEIKRTVAENWKQLGGVAGTVFSSLSASGAAFAGWLITLALTPVVTFYLLRDWDDIVQRVYSLLPPRHRTRIGELLRETDEVLGSFVRGQLLVMSALATIYTTGLMLVGLDLALAIGMVAGLVSFVPYLGFIVGISAASLAALVQFHDPAMLLWVLAVFGVGQALEGMVLTPYLVGQRIGLHPVAVIFAVMAGGQLFGFFGVLLALPAAAALMVWLRHLQEQYTQSNFYRRRKRT